MSLGVSPCDTDTSITENRGNHSFLKYISLFGETLFRSTIVILILFILLVRIISDGLHLLDVHLFVKKTRCVIS